MFSKLLLNQSSYPSVFTRKPVAAQKPSVQMTVGRRANQPSWHPARDSFAYSRPLQKPGVYFNNGRHEKLEQVNQILAKMPTQDIQALNYLFRTLMTSEQTPIGYTFFFDKPMSFVEFDEVRNKKLMPAFQIWKKYAAELLPDNVHFRLAYPIDKASAYADFPSIYILNKKAFLNKVRQHISDFREMLGHKMTPKTLFDRIMSDEENILHYKLKSSEALYGLLFGLTIADVTMADSRVFKAVYKFDAISPAYNNDHTRVILPQGLSIDRNNQESKKLIDHWQSVQKELQKIVDVKDSVEFLRIMLRKYIDDSYHPEFPATVPKSAPKKTGWTKKLFKKTNRKKS
jgi:hypothetical protein